jgi:hypothetical protein
MCEADGQRRHAISAWRGVDWSARRCWLGPQLTQWSVRTSEATRQTLELNGREVRMASALLIMNGRRRRCIVQSAVGARTLNPALVRRIETFGCTLTSLTRIAAPDYAVGESARLRRTECSRIRFSGSLIVGLWRLNAAGYVSEVCAPTGRRPTGARWSMV